ncbi:MAG: hypothetical protein ACM3RX_00900 [Methanococcaceae archaeon]
MGDAGYIIGSILGIFTTVFTVLDTVKVFGDYTIIDIGIAFLALGVVLSFIEDILEMKKNKKED